MGKRTLTRALTAAVAAGVLGFVGLVPAATTAAAAGQTISGVVTLPGGPDAAALDALTVMYALEGSSSYSTVDVTDTGAFSITGLAPARYHVCAYTGSYVDETGNFVYPANVLNACFNTAAADYVGARGVLDVTTGSLTGQTLNLPWGRTISGTVALGPGTNPEWLRGVSVTAQRPVTGGWLGNTVSVDLATGRYTVDRLYPGEHSVNFRVGTYTDPATGAEVVAQLWPVIRPGAVDVTAGHASGVDVTLELRPITNRFTTIPAPEITGSPVVGGTLTAVPGTWTPAATAHTYRWYRNGSVIPGATSSTYTVQAADLDASLHVAVGGTAPGIDSGESWSTWTTIRDSFTVVGVPKITGTLKIGSTLTCSPGTWAPTPGLVAYLWRRAGREISGAYQSTHVVTAADAGQQLRCEVQASRPGTSTVTARSAGVLVLQTFSAAGTVTVAGSAQLGATLTASVAGTTPAYGEVTYQWFRNGTAIPGASSATHVVALADSLATLGVRAVVTRSGFESATTAAAQVSVPGFFTATPAPTVTGTVQKNGTLSATTAAWTPTASFAYQWLRDGNVIPGATASTYALTTADEGTNLSVRVVGSRASFESRSATSAAVAVPRWFATAPTPTITGSTTSGSTLTAVTGTWSPTPDSFAYLWKRGGTTVGSGSTYALTDADLGSSVTVTVTASKSGHATASKTSAALAVPVGQFTSAPVPTVSGTAVVGSTLTATAGTWLPAVDGLTYQWLRDGTEIPGADGSSYVVAEADGGASIAVRVTAARAHYATTVRVSAAVAVPLLSFTSTPVPTISGTARSGHVLTAKRGTWTPTPATVAYQWFRNGTAIAGAASYRYTLTAADEGAKVTVAVTGTRPGYSTVVVTSGATVVFREFTAAPAPTITGTAKAGSTLTANRGTWTPAPTTVLYQWYRNGTAITGATTYKYALTSADKGARITVKVTGKRAGYYTLVRTSAARTVAS